MVYTIQAVGFPVAVAGFLLWRLNGKVGAFVEAAQAITAGLKELSIELHEHRQAARGWAEELRREIRDQRS